jgi:DNA anti-recombination protein RmuC
MEEAEKAGAEQRRQMIAEAAYLRAERRGFDGGDAVRDWIEAEQEVDARLRHARWRLSIQQLEAQLTSANDRLRTLAKKASAAKADAREEWQRDLDKLAELRDKFEKRIGEFSKQSGESAAKAKQGAEKVWDELSDALQKLRARGG